MGLHDNPVTKFSGGVGTVRDNDILAAFGLPDPTKYHVYFDDFHDRVATDGTTTVWTDTVNSGSIATTAANNGVLTLTTHTTDESICQCQRTRAMWTPAVGKKFFMKTRAKVSTQATTDMFIGLAVIDTALIAASALDMTDAIGFFKAATDTSLTAVVRKDATTGATTKTGIGTVVADTYFTAGLYYDGLSTVYIMFNDSIVATLSLGSDATAYLPDTVLAESFCVGQEGGTTARVLTVDYLLVAQER